MLKFAANITTMFKEYPYLQRFSAAAGAGFKGIETQFPYEFEAEQQKELLQENQLRQILICAPAGDWEAGERGIAACPGRKNEFTESINTALEYANVLECENIHVLAGLCPQNESLGQYQECYIQNIKHAGMVAAEYKKNILIESINTYDMPGYFLNMPDHAVSILHQINLPNVRLQLDLYHCQLMAGNLTHHITNNFEQIEHLQISGVPNRHEPDEGEVNYGYIFSLLDKLNYHGWIGCEYNPKGTTEQGLGWLKDLLKN